LVHRFDNHHAPDTAEDLLSKSASGELVLGGSALAVEVRDYGSLLSSAFMPEDCEDLYKLSESADSTERVFRKENDLGAPHIVLTLPTIKNSLGSLCTW
jgi:hypothetical protein